MEHILCTQCCLQECWLGELGVHTRMYCSLLYCAVFYVVGSKVGLCVAVMV